MLGTRIRGHIVYYQRPAPMFFALCPVLRTPRAIFQPMAERRYDDQEMAAIFRAASEGPRLPAPRDVPPDEGLTLADLQAIGREVGIAPEAVAQAAHALDIRQSGFSRTFFGLPIGVGRTVDLDRKFSDEEWERLVVQLREVFNARGVTRSEGSLRQWTNGNLQVLLEPTDHGHRLRLGSVHGGARASMAGGLMALVMAGFVALSGGLAGNIGNALPAIGAMVAAGVLLIANGAFRLPRWARLRSRQMEVLAAGVATSKEPPPPTE